MAVGDFDQDGNLDLVTINGGVIYPATNGPGTVSLWLGRGDGTFVAAATYAVERPIFRGRGGLQRGRQPRPRHR